MEKNNSLYGMTLKDGTSFQFSDKKLIISGKFYTVKDKINRV